MSNSDGTEYHSPDEGHDDPLVQDVRDPSSFEARRERVRNPEGTGSDSEDGDVPPLLDMRNAAQRREGEEGGSSRANLLPRVRHTLGSFLNARKEAIRANRVDVLTALMDLFSAHPDGITGGLGWGNQINLICEKIGVWFSNNGPCRQFRLITAERVRRRLKEVENIAKQMHSRHHSNDQTGAEQEDVPRWAQMWFAFFDVVLSTETRTQREARQRSEMRTNFRSKASA